MPPGFADFVRGTGPAIVLLGWFLSGVSARLVAMRASSARRKGLYLGLGAANGIGLIVVVALALR